MNILLKVMLITISSTVLVLMLFDYDSGRKELNLPSRINCLEVGGNNHDQTYLCNACFKIDPKQKANYILQIESTHPFMMLSLKTQISGIFTCEEWLQGIDYESNKKSQNSTVLAFEPKITQYLNKLQNEHNQILRIRSSELIQAPDDVKMFGVSSSHDLPYQVVSFYSNTKQPSFMRIFQNDGQIAYTRTHILTLFTVSILIALLYVFHCVEKKGAFKKYWEHIFCVIGIFGTLLWILLGDFMGQYDMYLSFSKTLFFSAVFDTTFGTKRWLFFGIILITEFFLRSFGFGSDFYHVALESVFLLIITGKLFSECRKQYFFLEKNSNKKVYFWMMAILIVNNVICQYLWKNQAIGSISSFLIGYFCLISFFFGIKKLDGNDYQKLLKDQQSRNPSKSVEIHQTLPPTTTMYEQDSDQVQENELKKKGKR